MKALLYDFNNLLTIISSVFPIWLIPLHLNELITFKSTLNDLMSKFIDSSMTKSTISYIKSL
uniref:Uncharacterized protein n=1 Tax=Tetranychus urticae TaxID=32264 RepID=T1KX75_TETUR